MADRITVTKQEAMVTLVSTTPRAVRPFSGRMLRRSRLVSVFGALAPNRPQ